MGLQPAQTAPFPQKSPVGVLAGEVKPTVSIAEEDMLFVVDVGSISPADLPELDLQVVEELTEASALLSLGAFRGPVCSLVHGVIFPGNVWTTTGIAEPFSTQLG